MRSGFGLGLTMLFAVGHLVDFLLVYTQHSLLTSFEVDSASGVSPNSHSACQCLPLHCVVHSRSKGFIVVRTEADIEDRGSVLVLLDQLAACFLIRDIIQVDILIP